MITSPKFLIIGSMYAPLSFLCMCLHGHEREHAYAYICACVIVSLLASVIVLQVNLVLLFSVKVMFHLIDHNFISHF